MLTQLSDFLKINILDLVKGAITAAFAAILAIVYPIVESGSLVFDWNSIWKAALIAAVSYLLKNFFTNSDGQMFKKESK